MKNAKRFKTLQELRKYTIKRNLFFPLEEAKESYIISFQMFSNIFKYPRLKSKKKFPIGVFIPLEI